MSISGTDLSNLSEAKGEFPDAEEVTVQDFTVIASNYYNPLILRSDILLIHAPSSRINSSQDIKDIFNALTEKYGSDKSLLVIDRQGSLGSNIDCLKFNTRFVEKDCASIDPVQLDSSIRSAPVDVYNSGSFVDLMLHGLKFTAQSQGITIDPVKVRKNLEQKWLPLIFKDIVKVKLAVQGDYPIGFVCTVESDQKLDVIDIWAYNRTDLGKILPGLMAEAVESSSALNVRGSVVGHDQNAENVFQKLVSSGWTLTETYWQLSTN